jgi:hypothetical protein
LPNCSTESYATLQLVRDVAPDQIGIKFRLAYLLNVQPCSPVCKTFKLFTKLFDALTAATDYDTRSGCVYRYDHVTAAALDIHFGYSGFGVIFRYFVSNFQVFQNQLTIVSCFMSEPSGVPVLYDPQSKSDRMSFLGHAKAPLRPPLR